MQLKPDNQRSAAINDLFSKRPSFIISHGLSIILLVLLTCVIGTRFIQYPEVVQAEAVVRAAPEGFEVQGMVNDRRQKFEVGQQVRFRLYDASNASSEWITGKILSVEKQPIKDHPLLKLYIPRNISGSGIDLMLKAGESTRIEIVTGNIRLSERLLAQVRLLFGS